MEREEGPNEGIEIRRDMTASSGKMLNAQGKEFDLTALMMLLQDGITHIGIPTLTFSHFEIHEGHSYVSDFVVVAGTSIILVFRTPNTPEAMHLFAEFASESAAHMDIIQAPTWNTGTGAQNPVFNRDRNAANTSGVLEDTTGAFAASMNLVVNPAGLAGGTIIHDLYTWADKKFGDVRRDDEEFILRRNTLYAIRLLSDDGVKGLHLILKWYEHDLEE